MIGMSQIRKKTIQGIAIGAGIGVVGIGLTLWWAISTIKTYENGTNKKFNEKYTREVAVLTGDVIQGEVITSDMVTKVRVHNKTVPTGALSVGEISGQVAKYNIAANVPLTDSMLTDQIIAADIRSQEINTVLMPSDLTESDYIDIRIMYPNGTDYIVLAQKQVKSISGQTMWLDLAEDERLILNSAMVDSFLTTGTKLYATKYADNDSQIKIADELLKDAVAITPKDTDDGTTTDTNVTTTTTTKANTTDATAIVQGKLTDAIEAELDAIKSEDTDKAINSIFNLILKYKSFANTVTRTTENYQPNAQVMAMMQSNKNILEEAKAKLSSEARANIENGINNYKSSAGDEYSNVVSGAQEAISNQQTLRDEMLAPIE